MEPSLEELSKEQKSSNTMSFSSPNQHCNALTIRPCSLLEPLIIMSSLLNMCPCVVVNLYNASHHKSMYSTMKQKKFNRGGHVNVQKESSNEGPKAMCLKGPKIHRVLSVCNQKEKIKRPDRKSVV